MKIVVLDGFTLNPGDLDWSALNAIGECTVYDRTDPCDVVPRAIEAEVVYTNKTILSREILDQLPNLRFIGVLATGFNIVDIEAARDRNVPVCNIPTYGTQSVAQMTFAHILNSTQRVAYHAQTVRENRWADCPDFCYWDYPLVELEGQNLGILGFGRIGRATACLGLAFGMKILAYDAFPQENIPEGATMVALDRVFKESDFVSLHCPLTDDNHHMVNANRLNLMKPTAFLINTSRGPLVDEEALESALKNKKIAGAGIDVMEVEPAVRDHPLYRLDNCFITPHISWATKSARARLMNTAVENLQAFLNGKAQNVVNLS